jgi:fluoride exporter
VTSVIVLCVAAGGLIGAPARFLVDRFVADRVETEFPLGTFIVNISGSFLLGLLTGLDMAWHISEPLKVFLGTGFCGAYTTFSTWSYDMVNLFEEGSYLEAILNAFASLGIGLLAAGAGIALGLVH